MTPPAKPDKETVEWINNFYEELGQWVMQIVTAIEDIGRALYYQFNKPYRDQIDKMRKELNDKIYWLKLQENVKHPNPYYRAHIPAGVLQNAIKKGNAKRIARLKEKYGAIPYFDETLKCWRDPLVSPNWADYGSWAKPSGGGNYGNPNIKQDITPDFTPKFPTHGPAAGAMALPTPEESCKDLMKAMKCQYYPKYNEIRR